MDRPAHRCSRSSVLKQRIVTGAVLAFLLLGCVLSGAQILLSLLLGVFVSFAAWEWSGLTGCPQAKLRILYAVLVTSSLPFFYRSFTTPWVTGIVMFGTLWWCIAAVMVFCYQAGREPIPASRLAGALLGFFVLVPAWAGLVDLYPNRRGPQLLLLFFVMIWLVDSMAFFTGRRWGNRRLASRVSPGKSWEGFFAGILASLLAGLVYVAYENISGLTGMWLILLCLTSAAFSVIGDLFVSMFKRNINVKDTSHLLPGHGGVLDRIDSITASAPVFAAGIWMLGDKL